MIEMDMPKIEVLENDALAALLLQVKLPLIITCARNPKVAGKGFFALR